MNASREEKRLRFCMVTTFYPPYNFGGDGIFVHQLSNALARRGHSVDVIACKDAYRASGRPDPTGKQTDHPGVTVHFLESPFGFLSPLLTQQTGMPFLKGELKRRLKGGCYDVIHFHNISLIGVTALRYGKAVKLFTTHEHWLICPMHVLWRFDREVCHKKTCIRCTLAGRRPPQFWRYTGLMERSLKAIDAFIAPSQFVKSKHMEAGLEIPMTVLPHFIPASSVTEPRSREAAYFLYAGRLEKIKGVQQLIPVFQKHPEFRLMIAGDGEYREALKAQAGGAPNIEFAGRVERARLAELYRNATATIVSSICYEVFGLVVIESFAAGTPVIVNNLGSLPEVVASSGGGFTYDNEEELLTAIRKLAGDPGLRDEMGARGYEAFHAQWTEEIHLKNYFALIEDIESRKAAGAAH